MCQGISPTGNPVAPKHASSIKASWDSSRNSKLVLTLSTRTLASLLAQLLDKILFSYVFNFLDL